MTITIGLRELLWVAWVVAIGFGLAVFTLWRDKWGNR